jgi:hypothetical protein
MKNRLAVLPLLLPVLSASAWADDAKPAASSDHDTYTTVVRHASFKKRFGEEWATKFAKARRSLQAATEAHKTAAAALQAEKNPAKRAALQAALGEKRGAQAAAEIGWLELNIAFKPIEMAKLIEDWQKRIAELKKELAPPPPPPAKPAPEKK